MKKTILFIVGLSFFWTHSQVCTSTYSVNYSESFEDIPTPNINPCWSKFPVNNNSSYYYVKSVALANTGTTGISMRSTPSVSAVLISPEFLDLSSNKRISFWMRSGPQPNMTIGTMSDPADLNSFTAYSSLGSNDSNGTQWRNFKVDFATYSGTDKYVALKLEGYAIVTIDDFTYEFSPSCIEPINLSTVSRFATEATLDWDDNNGASSWDIEYGENGFVQGTGTIVSTTSKPYRLTNLTPSTDYGYYIRANCSVNDDSDWSLYNTFSTRCEAQDAGFNYGFEDSSLYYNTCWSAIGQISNGPNNGGGPTPENYRRMYESITWPESIIITPELIGLDATKRVKFWVNNEDGESGVIVGTMSNPEDASTFTTYSSISSSVLPLNEWKKIVVNFDTYTGSDKYIAIKLDVSSNYKYLGFDEFTYEDIPSCLEPNALTDITVLDRSIELQWTEQATATSWEIEYGPSGFNLGTGTVLNTSSTTTLVSGLYPDTNYDFYVRSLCGGEFSQWSDIHSVTTGCGPVELDYFQSFDQSVMANCWTTIPAVSTGATNAEEVTASTTENYGNSGYSARLQDYSLENSLHLISPEFSDLNSTNNRIRFWMNSRYNEADVIVGTMSDPANEETFTPFTTIYHTDMLYREWQQFTIDFSTYTGTDNHVAFKMVLIGDDSSIFDVVYIDQFEYSLNPSCIAPTNLEIVEMNNGNVILGWQENNSASSWEIEYGPKGFWQGDGTVITSTTYPVTISGLILDQEYDFYVRTICDASNTSDWSDKVSQEIGCGNSFETGYSYDFNNSVLDSCWNAFEYPSNSSSASFAMVNYTYNGPSGYSARLYSSTTFNDIGTMMVSPMFEDLATDKKIKFWISQYSGGLSVGTMSDPNDYTTFHYLATINGAVSSGIWEERTVYLADYNGTDKYIAFRQQKSSYNSGDNSFIDDFSYLPSVNCDVPIDFTVNSVLDNSAEISWTGSGIESQWEIEYERVGVNNSDASVLVSSNPYVLSNLLEGTEYSVRVRAKCDDESLFSNWTEPIIFETSCLPESANYFESFEAENELSPCWSKILLNVNDFTNIDVINDFDYGLNHTWIGSVINTVLPVTGNQFLQFKNNLDSASSSPSDIYLVSRLISDIDNNKRLRLHLLSRRGTSSNSTYNESSLHIGTMSDPSDINTFNLIQTITPDEMNELKTDGMPLREWKEHTIYFDDYTGTDQYIAIKHGDEVYGSEFFIDDFNYENIPDCAEPLYPVVLDTRYDSADIGWETYENSSPQSWEVQYGLEGFEIGSGTIVSASTSNLFTIYNLDDDTNYDFYVRANCGNLFSEWSVKQKFKTKCEGYEVGYFESFESQSEGFVASCWTGLRPMDTGSSYWDESINNIAVVDNVGPSAFTPNSGNNCVRHFNEVNHPYNNAVSDQIVLVSPRLIGFDNYNKISFYLNPQSSVYASPNEVIIGTLSDPDDYTTFTPYYTITNASDNENVWTKYEISFSDYYGTDEYIGIKQASVNDRQDAEQSADEEITLAWQDNNTAQAPNGWEVEYGPTGFTQGTGTTVVANTNPFVIQNLSAFTIYDYYVRANCNATDGYSNWSIAYTFNISCAFSAPFYENFDQYQATDGSNALIPNFCWTRSSNLFYSGIADLSNSYASFGSFPNSGFVSFNNNFDSNPQALPGYLVSPFFSDFDNTKMIKFSLANEHLGVQSSSNASGVVVGTMSNPKDRSTFTPYVTIEGWEIDLYGREFVVDFSTYLGTDNYVAFMHNNANSSGTVLIDDFHYQEIPTCIEPINVKVEAFNDTSATLSWENINGSGNYEIEYGLEGFMQGTGIFINTSTTSYQITGLTQNTNYEFFVRSNCNSDNSQWIGPINVITACNIENLPWEENFNTMSSYGQGVLPNCFKGENTWVSSNTNLSDYQVGEDDTHYLYFTYDEIGLNASLITPMFNLEAGTTYSFVFKIRKEAGDYSSQSVKVRTGLGNTHEVMTTNLNYFSDFDFGFYDYHPIETTFTPVVSGTYSFGLYFGFSAPIHTITLDSFSLDNGYGERINLETAPDVYDFEAVLPPSFILENTEESKCILVTEGPTNNKAINMKLGSTLGNWVDVADNNQKWINNQNGINKINFEIDATNETSLFMSFDLKQLYMNNPNESMFRVVTNGNVVLDNVYATSDTDYKTYEVDLSGLVGSNIRVSLQQLGRNLSDTVNPSDEAFVDNLKFTNTPSLSIDDFNFNTFKFYPNPTSGILNLKAQRSIEKVELFNIIGKRVYSSKFNNENIEINISNLPVSLYLMHVYIDGSKQTFKLIKKD